MGRSRPACSTSTRWACCRASRQNLLPASHLRRAQGQFFHQFVLAGTYRSLRHYDFAAARQVLALLALPALRPLPRPLRWLPLRWGLGAVAWLGSAWRGNPSWRAAAPASA